MKKCQLITIQIKVTIIKKKKYFIFIIIRGNINSERGGERAKNVGFIKKIKKIKKKNKK